MHLLTEQIQKVEPDEINIIQNFTFNVSFSSLDELNVLTTPPHCHIHRDFVFNYFSN